MTEPPDAVVVHVHWKRKWHILDAPVAVSLDGTPIAEGSVVKGFDLTILTTVGPHELSVKIPIRKAKKYGLHFPQPGEYAIDLSYSRAWGNFSAKCRVRRTDEQHQ